MITDDLQPHIDRLRSAWNRVALMGVDCQELYFSPDLPVVRGKIRDIEDYHRRAEKVLTGIVDFSSRLRPVGIRQVWLRHAQPMGERNFTCDVSTLNPAARIMTLAGLEQQALALSIPVDPADRVVDKTGASGFYRTYLEQVLRQDDIDTLLLAGGTKEECLDATARDAARLGFSVFILDDLVLEANPFSPQDRAAFMERHRANGAVCVSTAQILPLMQPAYA